LVAFEVKAADQGLFWDAGFFPIPAARLLWTRSRHLQSPQRTAASDSTRRSHALIPTMPITKTSPLMLPNPAQKTVCSAHWRPYFLNQVDKKAQGGREMTAPGAIDVEAASDRRPVLKDRLNGAALEMGAEHRL
jgi:hypothetical protein